VSECIFCAIARGEAARSLVHEDDDLLVVMDLESVNPGHALVLPKPHARRLADLDDRAAARLFLGWQERPRAELDDAARSLRSAWDAAG
jgi:diadenosine tetraphosphate (Ap4A) HIT family hydrolase